MRTLTFSTLCATTLAATGLFAAGSASAAEGCDSAGLALPDGFCATQFSKDAGAPRHLAVADNGVVYINLANDVDGHGLMALRDSDDDGVADERKTFGEGGGTGLAIHDGWLYAATVTDIYRYKLDGSLVPQGEPEHIVTGLPQQSSHAARGLAISEDGQREQLSYAELAARVAGLQQHLLALGVQPGDRVAALMPNTWQTVVGMLAAAGRRTVAVEPSQVWLPARRQRMPAARLPLHGELHCRP